MVKSLTGSQHFKSNQRSQQQQTYMVPYDSFKATHFGFTNMSSYYGGTRETTEIS